MLNASNLWNDKIEIRRERINKIKRDFYKRVCQGLEPLNETELIKRIMEEEDYIEERFEEFIREGSWRR